LLGVVLLRGRLQLGVVVQQLLLDGPDAPEHVHQISLNCIQGLGVLAKSTRKCSVLLCSMTIIVLQLFVGRPQRLMAAQGTQASSARAGGLCCRRRARHF
tara:strand:- start:69 stop:368 length:300 start_codon:yes stop_codon:yes gene_type:complete